MKCLWLAWRSISSRPRVSWLKQNMHQDSHEHFTIINLICFDKLLYLEEHDDISTFEVWSWLLSIQALTSYQYKCGIQGPLKYLTRCHLLIEFVVVGFWLTILLKNKHLLIPIQSGSMDKYYTLETLCQFSFIYKFITGSLTRLFLYFWSCH